MRDVNKAVIKAAEAYYLRGGEDIQPSYQDLMEAVRAMLADRAAREVASKDLVEEPPIGSRVRDCDGDVWRRAVRGWTLRGTASSRWEDVRDWAPLTLLPTDE